jgi:glucokinase
MKAKVAVGIDLGGTNLKVAAVSEDGRALASRITRTDASRGPDAIIADMVDLVDAVLAEAGRLRSDCAGVGVGSPGPLSPTSGRIIRCANLPGWDDVPLRARLADRLKLPVVLDNDANAAAYGEFWVGAGRDGADMVMLTLGTGVGSGVIVKGRILHGHFENAGELGHMIIVPDGLSCGCGQRGCLEAYASAAAVSRRVIEKRPNTAAGLDAEQVAREARRGDAICLSVWTETCRCLALACVNIQHAFNPARVVLGGGMALAGAFLADPVREELRRLRWTLHDDLPEIILAELGSEAGVIGAAGLAWSLTRHGS